MDINALQQKSAAITPLKLVDTKQPVSSSAKSVDDATQKTKTPLEPTDVASVAKAKDSKKSDDLQQAVSLLNDYVQNMQRDLQFSIDKESGVLVVKVIDTKSEKVIRQIPNEETLKMARSLAEHNNEASFSIFSSRA